MTKQTDEAIRYLESNPNIQQDRYSMEALHYIKQALEQKKELESKVKEYFNLEQYMNEEPHLITKDAKNEYNDLKKDILNLIGENDG
jgi:hypothetical protein